jgi:hypothetical protein
MSNMLPSVGGKRNQENQILIKFYGIQFRALIDNSQQIYSIEIYHLQLKH